MSTFICFQYRPTAADINLHNVVSVCELNSVMQHKLPTILKSEAVGYQILKLQYSVQDQPESWDRNLYIEPQIREESVWCAMKEMNNRMKMPNESCIDMVLRDVKNEFVKSMQ